MIAIETDNEFLALAADRQRPGEGGRLHRRSGRLRFVDLRRRASDRLVARLRQPLGPGGGRSLAADQSLVRPDRLRPLLEQQSDGHHAHADAFPERQVHQRGYRLGRVSSAAARSRSTPRARALPAVRRRLPDSATGEVATASPRVSTPTSTSTAPRWSGTSRPSPTRSATTSTRRIPTATRTSAATRRRSTTATPDNAARPAATAARHRYPDRRERAAARS